MSYMESIMSPYLKMKKSDKYNGSGCLDMTAFMALKNIERERVKKSGHKRKLKKKKPALPKLHKKEDQQE